MTSRLSSGGRIDRSQPLTFTFDGRGYAGFAGDTLASALLANGVKLVGRSFKYHRPRGIVTAGVEEPTGLVTLRSGGRREPNVPAPMAELYDGLDARSQNAWPSPAFDLLALNGLFKPFLAAGFYYKTFMGPFQKSWMWYEPIIRRAAGLGVAASERDPDRYEKVNLFADVLVVGGGPAGLAAALAAGRAGARVLLAEQMPALGGALLNEPANGAADGWSKGIVSELRSLPNVTILTRTTVFGAYDGGTFGLVERVADHKAEPDPGEPRQRYIVLRARQAVIAAGAIERPIPFGNNDRPGVMLASAARAYLNRFAVLAGRNIVVFTNNDSAYAAAADFKAAGAAVTVIDARPALGSVGAQALNSDIKVIPGHAIAETYGSPLLQGVAISPFDLATGQCDNGFRRLAADLVCVSGGYDPQVHLSTQRGPKAIWDAARACFLPGPAPDIQLHAGAMTGRFATADCIRDGYAAGAAAAHKAGATGKPGDLRVPETLPGGDAVVAVVWDVIPPKGLRDQKRFIDLQNDVSASDIKLAHLEGYVSVEHLKRYTTLGMATEQGKLSNVIALAQMAKLRGIEIPQVGTTGFRAPYTSVSLGALAGHETDEHLRPVRRTPFHRWNERQDCVFIDAGLWKRPWYYPRAVDEKKREIVTSPNRQIGNETVSSTTSRPHDLTTARFEDVNAAYRRETRQVRETVGMVDVSTLGKIDVQGPDAAEFLNRVYVNGWKSLEVGKARYGLMLRDDGFVLDDGTTSRLAEHHYFLTTTTAEAAKVMAHLEWLLQTAWPDLRVHVTSVTDQWAGMAVAGPNAKKLLADAVKDVDFSNQAFPYMGVRQGHMGDLAVRVHRVSFSGELAYEVFCPSGYGEALCDFLMEFGKRHALILYGVEALGALRIEKGHIAGGEIDGRHSLEDLRMEQMASKLKPYVGSVLRNRPEMQGNDRPRLVGLKAKDASQRIRPGMILQPHNGPYKGHGLGHVSSTTYSPALGHSIALGFVIGGATMEGRVIDAVYPLKGDIVVVEVVSPHMFDAKGERLHG